MNFFLDENFPKAATKILNDNGHTIFDIWNTKYEGADDSDIFRIAQEKKAIFLTTDKDFYHTIPSKYKKHYGIVIITLRHPNRDQIIQKMQYFLDNLELDSIKSKVFLFKDNNYSVFEKWIFWCLFKFR